MIRSSPTNQQGAALIVAMVMLVAMTVIGVTAARDTLLQVRMADSKREKQVGLEGAEAALRSGEDALWGNLGGAPPTPQALGGCTPCNVLNPDSLDPLAGATWNTNNVRNGPDLPETAQRPEFFIEQQQTERIVPTQGRGRGRTLYYYKVVGRSPGQQARVEAILRSTFVLIF